MKVSSDGQYRYDIQAAHDRADCIVFEVATLRGYTRIDWDPEPDGYVFIDTHNYSLRLM